MSNSKKKNKTNFGKMVVICLAIILVAILGISLMNGLDNHKSDVKSDKEEKEKVPDKVLTEEEKKQEEWKTFGSTLNFYKEDYLERYMAYAEKNPDLEKEMVVVYVNIGLDQPFYSNPVPSPNQNTDTVLLNKYHYLGEDYVPEDLETIQAQYASGTRQMQHNARVAFEQMAKDAKTEGYTVRAVSTYRSYQYQKNLYSNYTKVDGTEKADTYSARAGYSEHQTGLAVDVDNARLSYTSFGSTKEFEWMKENAYKYGFILRYTKENEPITGYKDEPWHYRYVGVEIATYIQNHPMTYEEYYVRFLDV